MESQQTHHSSLVGVGSPSSSPKQIVEVHSPTTSRALFKKSDQDLNQQRPVLHKYSAEQVEVVYHRRSGAKEVKASKRKKRLSIESDKTSSQSFSKKSSQSPSTTPSDIEDHKRNIVSTSASASGFIDGDTSLILPSPDPNLFQDLSHLSKEGKIVASPKSVGDINRLGLSFESLAVNISDGEEESVGGFSVGETVEEESQDAIIVTDPDQDQHSELVSKVTDLTILLKKLSEDVLSMEGRIKKLEVDTRAIEVDNNFLHERYVAHLQANSHVASDMKKIQALLNSTSGISILENKIDNLVKRVKRSNDGVEKIMYSNSNSNGNHRMDSAIEKMEDNDNDNVEEIGRELEAAGQTAHPGPNQ